MQSMHAGAMRPHALAASHRIAGSAGRAAAANPGAWPRFFWDAAARHRAHKHTQKQHADLLGLRSEDPEEKAREALRDFVAAGARVGGRPRMYVTEQMGSMVLCQ